MSAIDQFRLVARREVVESLRRRSVRIVLAVLFLASTAGVVLPDVIGSSGRSTFDVLIGDRIDDATGPSITAAAAAADIEVVLLRPGDVDAEDRSPRALVEAGVVDAAVLGGEPPTILARASASQDLVTVLAGAVGATSLTRELESVGLDVSVASQVASSPRVRFESVDTADHDERQGVASIAQLVVYIALLSVAMQVANGTAIEKASRISEVLLAIVRPGTLLFGKVVGVGLVSLAGVAALVAPVAIKATFGGSIPASAFPAIVASIVWFVLGGALYAILGGTLGSLVERQEEVGTAMQPLLVVLIATFIVSTSNRESTIGLVLGLVPFTSPLVEPARIALRVASTAEIAASVSLLVATGMVAGRLGGAVYRRAIVRTGARIKLRDLVRR